MKIDVSSILKEAGGQIEIDGCVSLPDTKFLGEYRFPEPIKVKGGVSDNGKSLILRADSGIDDSADVILFRDSEIEIDDIVYDNFLMHVEGKYLCKEDCKGICPECGKDLNEGECDCSKENIDPRWSALLDIMKDNE